MSKTVDIKSLSEIFEELLESLERGGDIVLNQNGNPVARLVPYQSFLDEIDIHPGIRTSIHVWKESSGRVHLSKTKIDTPEA